jgi:hypothetical protein
MNNQPFRNTRYRRSRREGYLGSPANWTGRAPRTYGWREMEEIADAERERSDAFSFFRGLINAMLFTALGACVVYTCYRAVMWLARSAVL